MKTFDFEQFVQALSNPDLKGRVAGTKTHEKAKDLIVEELGNLESRGWQKLIPDTWEQPYSVYSSSLLKTIKCANLIAVHQGKPGVTDWILIGAHYDHLYECPGANDNAASVGIVLEAMHKLADTAHDCNVIAVFFDTEEPPFFDENKMGSQHFYHHLPEGLLIEHLRCAIVLDLVGHEVKLKQREQSLFVVGVDSGLDFVQVVNEASASTNLDIYKALRGIDYSDHLEFNRNHKPHLFLTAGVPWHYHSPHDTYDKLSNNLPKLHQISELVYNLCCIMRPISEATRGPSFTLADEHAELKRFLNAEHDQHVAQRIKYIESEVSIIGYRALHAVAALLKSIYISTFESLASDLDDEKKLRYALSILMKANTYLE